ncbi:hypothetical protein [Endozoicomonas euniceicola]|uniref:Uncharacterized protein n=1 Tax=Endozoicomonas euniceicola TaxID=1234143 RepID=A0ABY6H201_9GAMM|nr:hypothetical protein [Endozoicomonas euniceicola]UYM18301.1 hypothetical protein NX720_10460 [Endozoicomonas euniceicola]
MIQKYLTKGKHKKVLEEYKDKLEPLADILCEKPKLEYIKVYNLHGGILSKALFDELKKLKKSIHLSYYGVMRRKLDAEFDRFVPESDTKKTATATSQAEHSISFVVSETTSEPEETFQQGIMLPSEEGALEFLSTTGRLKKQSDSSLVVPLQEKLYTEKAAITKSDRPKYLNIQRNEKVKALKTEVGEKRYKEIKKKITESYISENPLDKSYFMGKIVHYLDKSEYIYIREECQDKLESLASVFCGKTCFTREVINKVFGEILSGKKINTLKEIRKKIRDGYRRNMANVIKAQLSSYEVESNSKKSRPSTAMTSETDDVLSNKEMKILKKSSSLPCSLSSETTQKFESSEEILVQQEEELTVLEEGDVSQKNVEKAEATSLFELTSESLEGFPDEIPLKGVSQIIQETEEAGQEDLLNDITALISEEEEKEKLFATLRQDIGETGSSL